MRPLRVMLVMEATDGGTGRYLREVALALCRQGLHVHVVCAARRNPAFRRVMAEMRRAGVRVSEIDMCREVRPVRDLISLWQLWRLFHQTRVDVIHVHSSKAGALGRLAAALAGRRPVAYTPHAYAFLGPCGGLRRAGYLAVERVLGRWTNHVIAVSDSESRRAVAERLSTPLQTTTIPNGLADFPPPQLVMEASQSSTGDRIVLGFLGRLEPQKAPAFLIDLAAELQRRNTEFVLWIGGEGSLREHCERMSKGHGLTGRIRFLGHVTDTTSFYRSTDIYVLTSHYEGLPYSVLDAMAWALPVVAFRVDGVGDAVVDGITGLLAEPHDVEQLADYVIRLVRDPQLRRRLGQAGRERVCARFRLDRQVRQLEQTYRDLVGRASKPSIRGGRPDRPPQRMPVRDIRVLFVSHCGILGGAERSLLELMQTLPDHGVRPMLACPAPSALAHRAGAAGIQVLPLPLRPIQRQAGTRHLLGLASSLALVTGRFAKLLRRRHIQLVHANTTIAQIWVGLATRLARVPCIWHWRDFHGTRWLDRILLRTASACVAVSHASYRFAEERIGHTLPLSLIYNGVQDHSESVLWGQPNRWRREMGIGGDQILVALVGQPIRRKGHEVFIHAFANAIRLQPNLRAIAVCQAFDPDSREYVQHLHQLAHDLGCANHVVYVGASEDVPALLRESDMIVVPSLREPFGRVAVEAMLAERPVIASNVDGLSEIVLDGETGILVPPGDWGQLSRALCDLASHPEMCSRMGRAGRRRALQRFSIDRTATEVSSLYRCVLGIDP